MPTHSAQSHAHASHQDTSAGYLLTDEEKSLDCATLRGRMQIALLHVKSNAHMPQSSDLSRTMQSSVKNVFGGTAHFTDQNLSTAYEISRLKAYNHWLRNNGCQTFDLARELADMQTKNPTSISADGV